MGPTASPASHNPGRERAIEALIDREPQGDYCRAVRVVDEAFAAAQNSRPNLITKAALVDQAFALAVHDVDTLAKYDLHLSEEADSVSTASTTATTPLKQVDALTRERIFHYQAKILSAKLNPKPRSNSCDDPVDRKSNSLERTPSLSALPSSGTCSPPASLVAALRRVYDDGITLPIASLPVAPKLNDAKKSKHAFELRQLLQSVSSHSVFHSVSDDTSSISKNAQANLEKLILNVAKLATDSSADRESSLQALLVAILSLSTSPQHQTEVAPVDKVGGTMDDTDQAKAKQPSPSKEEQDDVPFQSVLQVGALLSLFNVNIVASPSVDEGQDTNDVGNVAAASGSEATVADVVGHVDPGLLEYFSAAAAVYEERWEIQMARMLARMQTPLAPSETQPDTPALDLVLSSPLSVDDIETHELTGDSEHIPAETPTGGDRPDMDESQTSARASSPRPVIVPSDGTANEAGSTSAPMVEDEPRDEIVDDESSDSESDDGAETDHDEEDHDEPYESNSDGVMDDAGNEDGEQPDNDEGGDESSSSSESSDDEGVEIGDSDGVSIDESDDGDEAILRQALALSMAVQQEAAAVAARTEATTGEPLPPDASSNLVVISSTDDEIQSCDEATSPIGEEIAPSDPVTSTSDDSPSAEEGVQDEEANLPRYPDPPTRAQCSFRSSASSSSISSDDPDISHCSKISLPLVDPSELGEFGAIPVSHVLLHLLRYTASLVDQRVSVDPSSLKPSTVVAGGMGSSFLPVDQPSQQQSETIDSVKLDVTLQLLVATFLLLTEKRNDAIESLLKAISSEQHVARGGNLDRSDSDEADDDSSGVMLPSDEGEEDDPALTLAMNYVEDDTPLSSESLENKGMMRKAAAAAHDAAAMMKSLRKRTDAWKLELKLLSTLVTSSMRILRQFLRSVVRSSFVSGTSKRKPSILELQHSLPPFVASKLSDTLESLTTVTLQNAHITGFGGDEVEFERLFLSHCLCREGMSLWGECIPLLHASETARSELLKRMMEGLKGSTSLKSIGNARVAAFPSSDSDCRVLKMGVLCRRLRIGDLLDGFVSRPIPFVAPDTVELDEKGGHARVLEMLSCDPFMSSSLVSQMGEFLDGLESACGDIHRLYLALCHRYHARTLLLDGFYAASSTESGDRSASSSSRIISTGDLVRVASGPSTAMQFDGTNCSDSIALLSGFGDNSNDAAAGTGSVHQRASKVWGTVLSTHQFSPKTGVHRWAVRLDKCERGHVFIGVATAQASTRTYVGGDKYGWGMIGTQALWHDRRKIRGDYGATFRTGSTIIVTLDTDIGTLSFSSWKDCSSSSSFSLDPLVQNIMSPRRSGQIGGTIDNWGIAFEGLPLDAKLYPAVGLYQRDDRVSLLTVEANETSVSAGFSEVSGGDCYYPSRCLAFDGLDVSEYASRVRRFNDLLTWDGIRYAAETLEHALKASKKSHPSAFVTTNLIPSLGAAICLLPATVPVLSTRFSLFLSPTISRSIVGLQDLINESHEIELVSRPRLAVGKWSIRTTGSTGNSSKIEEYVADFVHDNDDGYSVGISGSGTSTNGRMKNGKVQMRGCCQGSLLTFVEDWSMAQADDSLSPAASGDLSCVISARLSLDGRKFEGVYRNAQGGSVGHIVGVSSDHSVLSMPSNAFVSEWERVASLKMCGTVLSLALSHTLTLMGDDAAGDLEESPQRPLSTSKDQSKLRALKCLISRPLLSLASLGSSSQSFESELKGLEEIYGPPKHAVHLPSLLAAERDSLEQLDPPKVDTILASRDIPEIVAKIDDAIVLESGGLGSLRSLSPTKYIEARQLVICALLHQCRMYNRVPQDVNDIPDTIREEMRCVWRASLNILEGSIRRAISPSSAEHKRDRCAETCQILIETSKFLLQLEIEREAGNELDFEEAITELTGIYSVVDNQGHLDYLRSRMSGATKGGLLRLISLREVRKLTRSIGTGNLELIESLLVGLPRQLGRGKGVQNTPHRACEGNDLSLDVVPDLDGTYLSRLSGLDIRLKMALKDEVSALFQRLGQVADDISSQDSACLHDSVLISFMSCFIGQQRQRDIHGVLSGSRLLSLLPKVFSTHRNVMVCTPNIQTGDDMHEVVQAVQQMFRRDVSRAVLRCAVAAFHIIVHHISSNFPGTNKAGSYDTCSDLLLTELALTLPYIEDASLSILSDAVHRRSEDEWINWQSTQFPGQKAAAEVVVQSSNFLSSLWYLRDHGCLSLHSQTLGQLQKPSSKGAASRSALEYPNKSSSAFAHQLLSHWLDILCAFLRSQNSISVIAGDRRWVVILFKFVGLVVKNGNNGEVLEVNLRIRDGGILPARFRARVVRLMLPLLLALEPNQAIVDGLFHLAGVTSALVTQSHDIEESFVSREAISLLRQLHLPCSISWREMINRSILALTTAPAYESGFCKKVGILSFFSGSLETISRGSFVLMKPSASSVLSPDHHSSPSSKSHPSGISGGTLSAPSAGATPHHLVGNGTISVVSGLSRLETSAGIVSNIDIKSGICEVILVARDMKERNDRSLGSDSRFQRSSTPGSSSSGNRQALTVRAVRTPLVDVVHAQEVPLFLDSSIPVESLIGSILNASLKSLLSAASLKKAEETPTKKAEDSPILESSVDVEPKKNMVGDSLAEGPDSTSEPPEREEITKLSAIGEGEPSAKQNEASPDDSKSIRSGVLGLSSDLMTLRCCVVLLSEKRVAESLTNRGSILANVLNLAWPDDKGANASFLRSLRHQSLSNLPIHEATFGHLVSLLRDLNFRMLVMKQLAPSRQECMLEQYRSLFNKEAKQPTASEIPTTEQPSSSTNVAPSGRNTSGDTSHGADSTSRAVSSSTGASLSDDEESEAAATAAAHLREAAIAQMAELGLPRSWSELALRKTGGINIEAAVTFCLERGSEIERMLAEEQESGRASRDSGEGSSRGRRSNDSGPTNRLLRQLLEMGFPKRWCAEALAVSGNDVDEALTWILNNGERLSEEDERMEGADDDEDDDGDDAESVEDEEDETEAEDNRSDGEADGSKEADTVADDIKVSSGSSDVKSCWTGSVIPLRFISGRAIVDPVTMELAGLPNGGFSSVGTKGILHTNGKWYYEAVLETAGCLQIGWADGSFAGHCHADRGDGCGDGPSSWAYDGWRRYRWHATATEWGCRWKQGDVVGCLVDMDERIVAFTLNGKAESIGMGVAFTKEGFRPCGGVYACVSFNRREKLRFILGGRGSEPFKHEPPAGYRGVGEAVLEAVKERDHLLSKETVLDVDDENEPCSDSSKRFLCDFSDGDHGHELMAWSHRYYGSDASVHLGSSRSKTASSKSSAGTSTSESKRTSFLSRRLLKAWSEQVLSDPVSQEATYDEISAQLFAGYEQVQKRLTFELFNECLAVAVLHCRKLLLHLLITEGSGFNPNFLHTDERISHDSAVKFWNVLEACTSLRSAGWVGEAGAMAISAEAVGLGISSNEQTQIRSYGNRNGVVSANEVDEGLHLPTGGYTQVLSTVLLVDFDSSTKSSHSLPASCAEAAMGSDGGGGILAFLQEGLQSAVRQSPELRCVLVAATRRAIRVLSVVEYDGDDFEPPDKNKNSPEENEEEKLSHATQNASDTATHDDESNVQPDARLTAFVTGLLLSKPVQLTSSERDLLQLDLFEAWSVGLLSSSLPFRMICALTVAGILNLNLTILGNAFKETPTLARYFGRLQSTVTRRIWAERAAVPVGSRYAQALIELLSSVHRSVSTLPNVSVEFSSLWGSIQVDASTPIPFCPRLQEMVTHDQFWETGDCWVSSDSGWDVWTGTVEFLPVDWKTPTMSSVRTLMDGGDGPPMLRVGDTVIRGLDWDKQTEPRGNDDGKDLYDAEKALRDEAKKSAEADETNESPPCESLSPVDSVDPVEDNTQGNEEPSDDRPNGHTEGKDAGVTESGDETAKKSEQDSSEVKKNPRKLPSPKLPIGLVLSIEPWNGIPGKARRVRWNLTGKEGIYRYGGDGGLYDLCHVEVNSKGTRIKKRHPLPESSEQCAARHGFGARVSHTVLLRLRRCETKHALGDGEDYVTDGVLEWPGFGSGIRVRCTHHKDGSVSIEETQLLFGSKDSGWISRFGQPSFVPGCTTRLSLVSTAGVGRETKLDKRTPESPLHEELVGRSSFEVDELRNPADGKKLTITSEMRLYRGCQTKETLSGSCPSVEAPLPPPITFDRNYHASSLSLSRDNRTVSCVSPDGGRCSAFASMGFTKGVHYWEVKLEQADAGSVFIGVAEKPIGSGSGSSYCFDSPPRLTRWHGWGFVNFRATYTSGAERIFGSHCHSGDTVGVLLDCDAGRVSFFFDGLKYGEHILNDLGCAFENLSPFGFNVDGCGSGGAGQGAPSGFENGPSSRLPAQGTIRPRTLWPVIGLRNQGDRVTLSSKWSTTLGIDGVVSLRNTIAVDKLLNSYYDAVEQNVSTEIVFPSWFAEESFSEYKRWISGRWTRSATRGSGPFRLTGASLDVYFDVSPLACAATSATLGLNEALLSGDRVKLTRSAGRIIELAEEAVVLGTYQGRLYYKIVSQKSEGGSLNEGGGRAWCWDESEVVDCLPFVLPSKGRGVALPKLKRFTCEAAGGLRVVYENGAVLRSDLEIFDASITLGTIPVGTIVLPKDVLDRRINSCGVVRFRVRYAEIGEGWISARIRGGTEELIVEPVEETDASSEGDEKTCYATPMECASVWYEEWKSRADVEDGEPELDSLRVGSMSDFQALVSQACIPGLSIVESDAVLVSYVNEISNFSDSGDSLEIQFPQVASSLSFALSTKDKSCTILEGASAAANQAAAAVFANYKALPTLQALLTRLAVLRALNRRTRLALPWLPIRPCQEGSAILGGLFGHGTTPDRAGRARVASDDFGWIQVPSMATKLRSLRQLIFTSVKRDFVHAVAHATTTPTPLSHDEYELPREIRTVRINRLKAGRAMLGDDRSAKRKYSVYSQLHTETKNWGGAGLRRGYVAKGHGGQKRAFKVKLIGEGVNDYSGPYREAFTDAMAEVVRMDESGQCPLGVLDATPNAASSIGENRDLFMFSLNGRDLPASLMTSEAASAEDRVRRSFASLLVPRDEASREVEEALVFLGRLTGTAFRHGIPLDIPLPMESVWKALVEEPVPAREKLRELDELAFRQLDAACADAADKSPLLLWQQRMLNAFAEGLGNVLPIEILPLLTGPELRDAMCGNPHVDVDLLKQVVEYEGYTANDAVIQYFWETLLDMTNPQRKQFLQFVWARNRLPMREADFDAPFKIQKDPTKSDQALPSASTCFFTLTLPEYSSREMLRDKLLFAIDNVTTMETDFQTNSAEIAEGYRAF